MTDEIGKFINFWGKILVFLYILIFPFGQLLRFEVILAKKPIPVIATDLVTSFSLITFLFSKKPKINRYFFSFFFFCLFSLLISLSYFNFHQVLFGSLYLFRLLIYYSFFVLVWNLSNYNPTFKKNVLDLYIVIMIFNIFLGWLQYFLYKDLTYLKFYGWDDHLGRLVGTFFDPGFTGIIICSAFFVTFLKYIYSKKKIYLYLSLIFLISLLFTYSRASYLALLFGLILLFLVKKKVKYLISFSLIIFLMMLILPRGKGEGVRLERTKSILLRMENYKETLDVFRKSPLFGIGFNNICWAKNNLFYEETTSHSCFGSDSSFLLILATTGTLGFLAFLNLLKNVFLNLSKNYYGELAKIFLFSTIIHCLFVNSLFYPFVMGISALYLGLSFRE